MDCSTCPIYGDPCARLKSVLRDELGNVDVCPIFLANVISEPEKAEVQSQ
ncbi:MAG: hypothetical protein PHU23_00280 [Dehalococcoidales bacterium]|nr:hypothetical protein [Dehalococcoidales bacterium]